MTTVADNLQATARDLGVEIKCQITPTYRLIRVDIGDRTRIITTSHAARILTALRVGTCDPRETIRTTK